MTQVQVYRERLTLPAYEMLKEDINPFFDKYLDPYPYTQQNHFSQEKVDRTYDAVVVENEYFKLTVLPAFGGRLYSAYDKRAQREMFYRNDVVRPRMVGTRGAWISGGIEFNFPISHAPHTSDRVNVDTRQYEDGSASVIFGGIEQLSTMNWKVELRLYPGVASIEQNVKLYNPTRLEQRYYFWTNAAVDYHPRLRLVYPFEWGINNISASYENWPQFDGHDCSVAGQMPYAFETFGKLPMHNFFGVYDESASYGVVHYADRKKLKGAKFFTWGTDDYAEAWNRSLTEDGSAYIEIQSGPFESQMVYKFLKPHQTVAWSEYWYAIPGLGDLHYAEREIAVRCESAERALVFHCSAVRRLDDCELTLTVGGQTYRQRLDLAPERTAAASFALPEPQELADQAERFRFRLEIRQRGRTLLAMGGRDERMSEPPDIHLFEDARVVRRPESEGSSALDRAQYQESFGLLAEAADLYEAHLRDDPRCTVSLVRLGQIRLKQQQPAAAIRLLQEALRCDNRDAKARFLLGVAEQMAGRAPLARKLFEDIAADADYYACSLIEWIKTDMALGHWHEALVHIDGAGFAGPYLDLLRRVCERRLGVPAPAADLAAAATATAAPGSAAAAADQAATDSTPAWTLLSEYGYAERWLASGLEADRARLADYTGGDERVLLPVALFYAELGLRDDALRVLEQARDAGLRSALARLMLTWPSGSGGQPPADAAQRIAEALRHSLDYAFLNEAPVAAFVERIRELDASGRLDYVLGVYYYAIERQEDALARSLSAYGKGLRYTVLLRNLGYMYFKNRREPAVAVTYLEEDVRTNGGGNTDTLLLLDQIYKETGELDKREALIPLLEAADNRAKVLVQLTEIYLALGRYEVAYEILSAEEFENGEGTEFSGPCWREATLGLARQALDAGDRAMAKQWADRVEQYPAKLNYGDSVRFSFAAVRYRRGVIYAAIGEETAAVEQFRLGAAELETGTLVMSEADRQAARACLAQLAARFL
ncbi:DUF5107 domain-containing protein [Cohnella sp. 56]|uniref:DUF5107 domain-containing protein n=1 Tax=Cohnella sp. 56 TaxID=3113722 RepID=UPI0030E923D1